MSEIRDIASSDKADISDSNVGWGTAPDRARKSVKITLLFTDEKDPRARAKIELEIPAAEARLFASAIVLSANDAERG